jgi:O-antigen/teichoic acid export membrane protein
MAEERVSRNAGFALLSQLVGAALTATSTIVLARLLPAQQYGYLTFGMSVLTIASLFADLGLTSSTGRFLAERRADPEAAAAVFRTALRLKLQISLLAAIALAALAGPICDLFGSPGAAWTLRALALALFTQSVFLLLLGSFIALGVIRYNVVLTTVESVVETSAMIVLVVLTGAAAGAALGRAVGYIAGLAVGVVVARRVVAVKAQQRVGGQAHDSAEQQGEHAAVTPRRILGYAGPLLLVDAAFRVFSSIGILLISAIVGAGAPVATFGLAMQLTIFLDYPCGALSSAVAPRLARSRGKSDLTLLSQSMRYLVILQMLLAAPFTIWSEPVVHLLFGNNYPDAPNVLRALVPYIFLTGIAQITTLSVNYLGAARRRVPIALAMLTVNVVLNLLLLPRIGIVGGAIAASAAYAVWVPAHVWILRDKAGYHVGPLLRTSARVVVAGGALTGTLALIGTGDVPTAYLPLGAVAGTAVYVATLFALRELTPTDVAVVRATLTRRR